MLIQLRVLGFVNLKRETNPNMSEKSVLDLVNEWKNYDEKRVILDKNAAFAVIKALNSATTKSIKMIITVRKDRNVALLYDMNGVGLYHLEIRDSFCDFCLIHKLYPIKVDDLLFPVHDMKALVRTPYNMVPGNVPSFLLKGYLPIPFSYNDFSIKLTCVNDDFKVIDKIGLPFHHAKFIIYPKGCGYNVRFPKPVQALEEFVKKYKKKYIHYEYQFKYEFSVLRIMERVFIRKNTNSIRICYSL